MKLFAITMLLASMGANDVPQDVYASPDEMLAPGFETSTDHLEIDERRRQWEAKKDSPYMELKQQETKYQDANLDRLYSYRAGGAPTMEPTQAAAEFESIAGQMIRNYIKSWSSKGAYQRGGLEFDKAHWSAEEEEEEEETEEPTENPTPAPTQKPTDPPTDA